MDVCVALVTVPNIDVARNVANALVEARVAACVNIVPGVESIYRWEGKMCADAELLLIAKVRTSRASEVIKVVEENHPYSCPEVLFLEIRDGRAQYLDWVRTETK
ncbi:MAG: divalent-cation tolerance protein CutA [Deltaproteobacteria bacterium]|nr:divalent-cation tolerance protein CutA [Deltaproteobacteria bacterium]